MVLINKRLFCATQQTPTCAVLEILHVLSTGFTPPPSQIKNQQVLHQSFYHHHRTSNTNENQYIRIVVDAAQKNGKDVGRIIEDKGKILICWGIHFGVSLLQPMLKQEQF